MRSVRQDAKEADEEPKPKVDEVIRGIELLDGRGQPTTVIRTGESATLRFHLALPADEDTKVLRLEFMRDDGMLVSAVSTRESSGSLDPYSGEQVVDYHIPRVLLGTGTYKLGVVLATRWVELARSDGALHFDVANGALLHHGGSMLVGGEWEIVDSSVPQALPGN